VSASLVAAAGANNAALKKNIAMPNNQQKVGENMIISGQMMNQLLASGSG
jgi:hypothetical protein